MKGVTEVAVTAEGQDGERYFGLPKRGRVILYPDGILNIEDGGGRVTPCRWDITGVRLTTVEPLREMA